MPPSTNDKTWSDYSPVSMGPAATGWSAIYINDTPHDGGPPWLEEPVIAWAVYQVTSGQPEPEDPGTVHSGRPSPQLVRKDSGRQCVVLRRSGTVLQRVPAGQNR